jgi:hypothetical protein
MPKNRISNADYYWMGKAFRRTPMFGKILLVLRSIGHGLRLIGGALFLLVTVGPIILAPFYLLYLVFIDPWFLLNPAFLVAMLFSVPLAVVAVAVLVGRA